MWYDIFINNGKGSRNMDNGQEEENARREAEHAAEIPDPEKDPAYLEIIRRRNGYAASIPGLAH